MDRNDRHRRLRRLWVQCGGPTNDTSRQISARISPVKRSLFQGVSASSLPPQILVTLAVWPQPNPGPSSHAFSRVVDAPSTGINIKADTVAPSAVASTGAIPKTKTGNIDSTCSKNQTAPDPTAAMEIHSTRCRSCPATRTTHRPQATRVNSSPSLRNDDGPRKLLSWIQLQRTNQTATRASAGDPFVRVKYNRLSERIWRTLTGRNSSVTHSTF